MTTTLLELPLTARPLHGRVAPVAGVTGIGTATARAGLTGLSRSLARELGLHGICVNTVVPGAIQVPAQHALPTHHRARPEDQIARQCVTCRGQPEDVAAAIAAGPAASFIIGRSSHIDGGWLLH
ncbi:enoyl-ACP reductase-like protein [Streptomyces sp. TLI_235]|nr:SDR family oxidoreductase [Streptomyces sp. TLI_235]PBC70310.1 enoyl-ACP reductase-like protein [Streptomyces sp. TLI_235]